MPIKLYGISESPAVRSTLLTIAALGLDVEVISVNTLKGEQLTPEFRKLNPLHTIPTIKDGDYVIWDSHAINSYLVDKYGKADSLYPKDLQKRAVVNQRLFYDCGVLYPRFGAIAVSLFREGAKTIRKDLADSLVEAYTAAESLLEKSIYIAGNDLTIADFSVAATLSTLNLFVPIASNTFPKINDWLTKMQALPYYSSMNQKGLDKIAVLLKSKRS